MAYSVIFDWNRTLYNPDSETLIDGAHDVLSYLKGRNVVLYLVSRGSDGMRREIERLGVDQYFDEIVFTGEKKNPEHYKFFVSRTEPASTLLIGDKLDSEIEAGNLLGATTIQVRQGKFAGLGPKNSNQKPDMVVNNLTELMPLLVVYA